MLVIWAPTPSIQAEVHGRETTCGRPYSQTLQGPEKSPRLSLLLPRLPYHGPLQCPVLPTPASFNAMVPQGPMLGLRPSSLGPARLLSENWE